MCVSLYTEANELSLGYRRLRQGLQFVSKLMAYPDNPSYECVINPVYVDVYQNKNKNLEAIHLEANAVTPVVISKMPSIVAFTPLFYLLFARI